MLKKTNILKIDTSKASSKEGASTVPVICPHCSYLTAVLIENLPISRKCVTCGKSFVPEDAVADAKR